MAPLNRPPGPRPGDPYGQSENGADPADRGYADRRKGYGSARNEDDLWENDRMSSSYEEDDNQDFYDYDDDYEDERSSRGNLVAIAGGVVLGVIVVIAGAWFLLSGSDEERARDENLVPVMKAENQNFRERPQEPGGMQVDNQDKSVYSRLGQQAPGQTVEVPGTPRMPEQPAAPPGGVQPGTWTPPAMPSTSTTPSAVTPPPAPGGTSAANTAPPPPVIPPAPPGVPSLNTPSTTGTTGRANAPVSLVPSGQHQAPAAQPKETTPPARSKDQVASLPTTPSPKAATGGKSIVQFVSLRTQQAAEAEWQSLVARHGDLLKGLGHEVIRVDLGERGVFYRLRATGIADRAAAKALCDNMAKRSQGCLVVR